MDDIELLSKWVWLSIACGAGSKIPELLLAAFGGVEDIYEAGEDDFAELDMDLPCLDALCDKSLDRALYIIKWCEAKKVGILTPDDPRYPARLYEISAYPIVLYYFGRIPAIDKRLTIACVGTRRMTDYGANNAYAISRDLAKHGGIIVSGLALGIDSVCHRAALDVEGDTIAILGCGLDRAYPPQNRNLMVEIARHGTIFTEFAPFTKPMKPNFPMRNRIISGLSNATVVFEADEKSGSLITARHAKKQGRPVYALPGANGNLTAIGTNELLTSGARAVTCAGDILDDFKQLVFDDVRSVRTKFPDLKPSPVKRIVPGLGEMVPKGLSPENSPFAEQNKAARDADIQASKNPPEQKPAAPKRISKEKADKLISELSLLEETVYNALSRTEPRTCDQLTGTGYPVNKILAALTMLEVKKLILSMPGGGFVRLQ